MDLILLIIIGVLVFAYVPMVNLIHHRDHVRSLQRRPVNEVLADAFAQGMLTHERFSSMMDEVHKALPTPDAPYPLVYEFKELK